MTQLPVVIGTNPERSDWLNDCLNSIRATTYRRRVFIHRTGGYEVAALRAGIERFSRFLFLHDSITILDPRFWDIVDSVDGPAWLTGGPPMHLGIHHRDQIKPILDAYPPQLNKIDSINTEGDLARRLNYGVIWPDITDGTALRREQRHGRDNLVLGNSLFEKHKGTWT